MGVVPGEPYDSAAFHVTVHGEVHTASRVHVS
jgi:hypothetical protein